MITVKFHTKNGDEMVIPFPKGYRVRDYGSQCSPEKSVVSKSVLNLDGTGQHYTVFFPNSSEEQDSLGEDDIVHAYVQNNDGKTIDVIGGIAA